MDSYRRGRRGQEHHMGLYDPESPLGKTTTTTTHTHEKDRLLRSTGDMDSGHRGRWSHVTHTPTWGGGGAEHPGSAGVSASSLGGAAVVVFTSQPRSIKFPALGRGKKKRRQVSQIPQTSGGLFPVSSRAEDLGLQRSGCGVWSSVSSKIKSGVTAENSCSTQETGGSKC